MDTVDNAITKPVHRLEVFTGAGRRRTWSDEDKARIVAEILTSGESLSAVARRHGLSPQQLFGWRRQLEAPRSELLDGQEPSFVPAVLDAVALDGMTVRIGPGAPAATIAAVLRALKDGT